MEVEHRVEAFPIDEHLQEKVQTLVAEGWNVIPGVPPVAVYNLVRERKPQAAPTGGLGKLRIDDTKIMVIPATSKTQ